MKKKIGLIILSCSICLSILLFMIVKYHFEAWYLITRQYIHLWAPGMTSFSIRASAKASNPGNFSSDMSSETYSDSQVFKTDNDFHHNSCSGTSELPFPPKKVYCETGEFWADDQSEFFFVALHSDGQHQEWVVHKASGSWKGIKSLMERIGCNIPSY